MEFVLNILAYFCSNLLLGFSLCADLRGLNILPSFWEEASKGFVWRDNVETVFVIKWMISIFWSIEKAFSCQNVELTIF